MAYRQPLQGGPAKEVPGTPTLLGVAASSLSRLDPAVVSTCFAIVCWFILTGVASIYLKLALAHTSSPYWATLIILAVSTVISGCLPCVSESVSEGGGAAHWQFYLGAGVLHGLNTLTLLLAFRMSGVALTYTVKAMEPLTVLVLSRVWGREVKLTWMAAGGLLTLPVGVFLSQRSSSVAAGGVLFSCCNVLLTASRSVLLKGKLGSTDPFTVFFMTSLYGLLIFLPLGVLFMDSWDMRCLMDPQLMVGVVGFLGYNLCSFFVLSKVETVFHGSLNVLKRLTTVIASLIILRPSLSPSQLLGIGLAYASLLVYLSTREKTKEGSSKPALETGKGEDATETCSTTASIERSVSAVLIAGALFSFTTLALYALLGMGTPAIPQLATSETVVVQNNGTLTLEGVTKFVALARRMAP